MTARGALRSPGILASGGVVLPHDQAQALADAAHQVCPSSNATRGNVEVTVGVSDD